MPDSFACLSIQSNQAICEEIVADAVAAVEIKGGRARWNIDNSALGIERHPGPIVRCAAGLPGVFGPSAIPKLPGMRNSVKRPSQLARRGIQRENFLCRSDSIENSSDDERIRLEAAFFQRVKAPCNSQVLDVAPVDLRKRRIVIVLRSAAIRRPILLFLVGRSVLWPRVCRAGDQPCPGDDQSRSKKRCSGQEYFENTVLFHDGSRVRG